MKPTGKGNYWEIKALNETANTADVLIYGDIGENWWAEESLDAKSFLKTLGAIPKTARLKARINSNGGSVSDALAMANALQRHPGGCDTVCDGIAASSAGLILMAGESVEMAENSLLMIHAPWSWAEGNSADFRQAADTLDKFAEAMATVYAKKCAKPLAEMLALLTDGTEHWYTAADALAEGFCDSIGSPIAIAAHATRFIYGSTRTQPPTEDTPMPEHTPAPATPAPMATPATPTVDADAIQAKAKLEFQAHEKQRREDIRTAYGKFMQQEGVRAILDTVLDDPAIDLVQARAKLLDHLGAQAEPVNPPGHNVRIEAGRTEREKKAQAFGNVLLVKAGLQKRDGQNPFMSYNLFDMARDCAEAAGVPVKGMDRLALARAALTLRPMGAGLTTSDFPILLENVLHKSLLQAYTATASLYDKVCKIGSVSDFRTWPRLRLGLIGGIEEVSEAGEYRYGEIPDASKESISLTRKGKIIQLTPELIINDDLGGLTDIAVQMGAGAKRSIDIAFFALLKSNPKLRDTKNFFHADHGNLAGTAAYPTQASLIAAKNAMRSQLDHSGTDYIETAPHTFLGPVGYDDEVKVINATAYILTGGALANQTPNLAFGLFTNIFGTPRLAVTGWYVFADPSVAAAFEVVFLDGQTEPVINTEQDFDTSGVKHKVELPFGIAPIDPTGAYYNAGGAKA